MLFNALKKFRQINYLVISLVKTVKTLISRKFCHKTAQKEMHKKFATYLYAYFSCTINLSIYFQFHASMKIWFPGTRWFGKCWHIHDLKKYEFDVEFDVPVTYPMTAPEIALPELDGKTAKMYRGGKICMTDHFKPLWGKNAPRFGIAHAMALGLGPWLAVEIPEMIEKGVLTHKEKSGGDWNNPFFYVTVFPTCNFMAIFEPQNRYSRKHWK